MNIGLVDKQPMEFWVSYLSSLNLEDWRNLILSVVAVVGITFALWRSYVAHKQVRLAEAGQNIDRYQKAADMLGDASLPVRQAGIFALQELVERNPKNYNEIVQKVLCSFVRDRSDEQRKTLMKQQSEADCGGSGQESILADVQAAITAFSELKEYDRRWEGEKQKKGKARRRIIRSFLSYSEIVFRIDLTQKTDRLRAWYLGMSYHEYIESRIIDIAGNMTKRIEDGTFEVPVLRADLRSANLKGAFLWRHDLSGCNLESAKLCNARLHWTNLSEAHLRETDLSFATSMFCDLSNANLTKANLYMSDLTKANLKSADLRHADLRGAKLGDANLDSANLSGADLRDANLVGANLNLVNLSSANLEGAVVSYEQLKKTIGLSVEAMERHAKVAAKLGPHH